MPVRPLSRKELEILQLESAANRLSRNQARDDAGSMYGLMSDDREELGDEEELLSQINSQLDRLRGIKAKAPEEDTSGGILGRVFDVVSRPVYATANAVNSLVTDAKENAGTLDTFRNLGREFQEGLRGKDKTTFSDVIENAGVTGDSITDKLLRGVGGFGLDIALDPTTYVSLGTSAAAKGALRGGLEAAQATASGKKAAQVLKTAAPGVGKKLTEENIERFVARGLADGTTMITAKEGKKLSERMVSDLAYEAALKEGDRVLKSGKRTFDVRFAGRPVARSERLYDVGAKLGKAFKSTDVGQGLSKTFSTRHKLPGDIHTFRREAEGYSAVQYEDFVKSVRGAFKGVPKEEKRLISDAIEKGTDLTGVMSKSGKDLGALQREAMDYLDSITQVEIGRGILSEDELLDNYVYHHYRDSDRDAVNVFKGERRKVQNPKKVSKFTTIKTLEEAEKLGLKPVREIDDILMLRAGKSYGEQARVAFADAVRNEFGVNLGKNQKLAKKLNLIPANTRYIKGEGLYLPTEVQHAVKHLDDIFSSRKQVNELMTLIDKGTANLKFLQTAVNPGHHIRNVVGDMFLNSLDGVTNPLRYAQAARVLDDSAKTSVKIGDALFSGEEIRNLYRLKGGKSGYTRVEIGARRSGTAEKIRNFAEAREDWTRMAHFIDALKKEAGGIKGVKSKDSIKALDEAASRAATRVRKWNFDYGDLTETERKLFRRVVPFYTWMRKNIPIQLEAMALRPGRQAVVPKALNAVQQLLGTDEDYPTIGGLQTVPKWLRDMSGFRIAGEGEGRNGIYFDPSIIVPSIDPIRDVGDPLAALAGGDPKEAIGSVSKTLLNQLHPGLRAGVEFGTGRNVFTGAELNKSLPDYLIETLPAGRMGSRGLSGETSGTDWINYLTGASLRPVGEQQRMSEYRRQQDSIEAAMREGSMAQAKQALGENADPEEYTAYIDQLHAQLTADAQKKKRAKILDQIISFSNKAYTQNQEFYG